jgi:hypothetical protein
MEGELIADDPVVMAEACLERDSALFVQLAHPGGPVRQRRWCFKTGAFGRRVLGEVITSYTPEENRTPYVRRKSPGAYLRGFTPEQTIVFIPTMKGH